MSGRPASVMHTDLVQLALRLKEVSAHPALSNAIDRALSIASAEIDLRAAAAALRLLIQTYTIGNGEIVEVPEEKVTVSSALFSHAVVLYARATETTPVERFHWWGNNFLSKQQRELHDIVIRLRNKGIGHFGRAGHLPGGALITETIIRRQTSDESRLFFRSERAAHRGGFDGELLALIEATMANAAKKAETAFDLVNRELETATDADDAVIDLMIECEIELQRDQASDYAELSEPGAVRVRHVSRLQVVPTPKP